MPPKSSGAEDHEELARVAEELLPRLISHFGASRLGELEIRRSGWRVRLRKGPDGALDVVEPGRRAKHGRDAKSGDGTRAEGSGPTVASTGGAGGTGSASSAAPEAGASSTAAAPSDRGRVVVTSPAVGYFLPLADSDVGKPIRQGDVVGHVDVLGVRQDVVASTDGVIGRLLAEAGEAVEYGQSLVRIDRMERLDPSRIEGRVAEVPV